MHIDTYLKCGHPFQIGDVVTIVNGPLRTTFLFIAHVPITPGTLDPKSDLILTQVIASSRKHDAWLVSLSHTYLTAVYRLIIRSPQSAIYLPCDPSPQIPTHITELVEGSPPKGEQIHN